MDQVLQPVFIIRRLVERYGFQRGEVLIALRQVTDNGWIKIHSSGLLVGFFQYNGKS